MILKRVEHSDKCTRGVLIHDDKIIAVTLENPWKDNSPNISCIPFGIYMCKRVTSPRFGNTFEVANVEGRTHILFHSGNTEDDTRGCLLLGKTFGSLYGEPAVLDSKIALKDFLITTKEVDVFQLMIVNV